MRRLTAGAALASLITVGAAAPAVAKPGPKQPPRTHVYWANLGPVAVGPYAMIPNTRGRAQLVDGKRNDKLSVHIRRAGRKATYVFRLEQSAKACEAGAPGGTPVAGWKYRRGGVLKTSRKGVANSTARSRTFTAKRGVEYFVGVYTRTAAGAPDQLVLCAELRGNKPHRSRGKDKPKGHGDKPKGHEHKPAGTGKPGDAPRGNGKPEDKPTGNGKSGDTPRGNGKPDDKPTGNGKSDDSPHGHGKPDDAPRGRGKGGD